MNFILTVIRIGGGLLNAVCHSVLMFFSGFIYFYKCMIRIMKTKERLVCMKRYHNCQLQWIYKQQLPIFEGGNWYLVCCYCWKLFFVVLLEQLVVTKLPKEGYLCVSVYLGFL